MFRSNDYDYFTLKTVALIGDLLLHAAAGVLAKVVADLGEAGSS